MTLCSAELPGQGIDCLRNHRPAGAYRVKLLKWVRVTDTKGGGGSLHCQQTILFQASPELWLWYFVPESAVPGPALSTSSTLAVPAPHEVDTMLNCKFGTY